MTTPAIPSTPDKPNARRPQVWRARAAALAMAAFLALGLAMQLLAARDGAIMAAEVTTTALAKAVAERVEGGLRAVDSLLEEVVGAAKSKKDRDDPEFTQRMLGRLEAFPEVRFIGVISADGWLGRQAWPSVNVPADGIYLGDREYFRKLKGSNPPPVAIGHPVVGRATDLRSIHVARPLTDANGEFAGVVFASFNPDLWAKFLATVMVDPEGATAVIHADGLMVARAPDHEGKFGIDIRDSDLFNVWLPKSPNGVAHLVSKADGNKKILAYRALPVHSLVVTSGMSDGVALKDWRRMAVMEIIAAVVLLAAAFYWAWRSDQSASQTLAYGQQLEAAVEARARDLAAARGAVEQNARRLHKVNVELQRMALVTAHHLQEPLRPMVSYSQLLEQKLRGQDAETDDMLAFIRNAAVRLKSLLRDFQRYVAALTEEPNIQVTDCGQAVSAAARAVARQMGHDALTVSCSELPTVAADHALLRDLFRELFANAVAHNSGAGPAMVRVDCVGDREGWTFRVCDNGNGIPVELRDRVFQVFESASGRSAESTGLGLPLCRLIVEAHGGDISIEDSETGAVVRFFIPDRASDACGRDDQL